VILSFIWYLAVITFLIAKLFCCQGLSQNEKNNKRMQYNCATSEFSSALKFKIIINSQVATLE